MTTGQILLVSIPALIALVGTIVTIIIQQRNRKSDKGQGFITDRQNTYKRLWEMLEDAHVKLRTQEELDEGQFKELLSNINAFILKNSLYLEDGDQALANRYLKAIRHMRDLIIEADNPELQDAMEITGAIPVEPEAMQELRQAVTETDGLRNELLERFRKFIIAG